MLEWLILHGIVKTNRVGTCCRWWYEIYFNVNGIENVSLIGLQETYETKLEENRKINYDVWELLINVKGQEMSKFETTQSALKMLLLL